MTEKTLYTFSPELSLNRDLKFLSQNLNDRLLSSDNKMLAVVVTAEKLANMLIKNPRIYKGKNILGVDFGFVKVDFKTGDITYNFADKTSLSRISPAKPGYASLNGVLLNWDEVNEVIQNLSQGKYKPVPFPLVAK